MISKVYIDASALLAFLNKGAVGADWVADTLKQVEPPLLTCQAVLSEVTYAVGNHSKALRYLRRFLESGLLRPHGSLDEHYPRILRLMHIFREVPMSFAEASLSVLVDQEEGSRILTLRSEFTSVFHYADRRRIPVLSPESGPFGLTAT